MTRILQMTALALLAVAAAMPASGQGQPAPKYSAKVPPSITTPDTVQTRIGTLSEMFTVPADGRIVAWTITLGKPGKKQQKFFEENLGGPSQAGITILKQGDRRYGRVLAQGPLQPLTSFFGQTAQFPLTTTLPVTKGSVVAPPRRSPAAHDPRPRA